MNEKKLKHLEFIQDVIARMSANSFMIKGWSITLISALFALSANDSNLNYVLITYLVIPVFWSLDGYFLSVARQYRGLYDEVRSLDESQIDFGLNASKFDAGKATWLNGIFSKTLIPFYGISFLTTLIVMFLIEKLNG